MAQLILTSVVVVAIPVAIFVLIFMADIRLSPAEEASLIKTIELHLEGVVGFSSRRLGPRHDDVKILDYTVEPLYWKTLYRGCQSYNCRFILYYHVTVSYVGDGAGVAEASGVIAAFPVAGWTLAE